MAPSTFASAAAGSNTPNTPSRVESGGEWARRTNGATQTFRRPSVATTQSNSNHQREASMDAHPARYVPPHRNGILVETRYSRNQLLDLYNTQQGSADSMGNLYVGGWEPNGANGAAAATGWNKRDESTKDHVHGPDVCWEKDGRVVPLALLDMTAEEKDVFATSVNSPLKAPVNNKEATPSREGVVGKSSISHSQNSPANFALSSPSATKPASRRRETSESYPFPNNPLASPTPGKTPRDDSRTASPPPALRRRATDLKDAPPDEKVADESADATRTPFSSQKRNPTGPTSAGLAGPASPWASTPTNAVLSPMGAFGNFAVGTSAAMPTEKRPVAFGSVRAESRFKGLMSKDGAGVGGGDDSARALKEKPSLSNLGRVNEASSWRNSYPEPTEALPDNDDQAPSGSAALGGGQDTSPPRRRDMIGTPSRQDSRDDFGFAAFGMTPDPNFRAALHEQYQHHTPQGRAGQGQASNEQMLGSPTSTNPYQSPAQHDAEPDDIDTDGSDIHNAHLPGLGGFMNESAPAGSGAFTGLANLGRVPAPPSDRSQTSSVGPQRGFGGLNGLGAIPGLGGSSGWGSTQATIGTPIRERAGVAGAFGENAFGSAAETQSPSLAGLGSSNFFGSHAGGAPGAGRGGSRLGSLFPQAMQEQMRGPDQTRQQRGDDVADGGDAFSRFGMPGNTGFARDTDSPFRQGPAFDQARNDRGMGGEASFGQIGSAAPDLSASGQGAAMQSQPLGSSASNQPPAAQQKTMVMPDRMRWIYRDPQGNTQGPWSGLEMHDWYKAGFFSPELLVKKYEDADYEPLAQLIRRIGNSREPFLVPQIGIPHGAPSAQSWGQAPGSVPASQAQPPFASSFPSFGTTLTADQQNALERRKQEEQYLMARQKEHLAQQQIAQRISMQSGHGMLPQQLHHHSSAHSLHSQPSFSNLTSPNYQPSPSQGPSQGQQHVPGFFDNSFRGAPSGGLGVVGAGVDALGDIKEEDVPGLLDRLDLGRRDQQTFGGAGQAFGQQHHDPSVHAQQVGTMFNDRARLQQEQTEHDMAQRFEQDQPVSNERLREFQELQQQHRHESAGVEGVIGKPSYEQQQRHSLMNPDIESLKRETLAAQGRAPDSGRLQEPLSLTEQVQQAASAQQSPAQQSPWGKIDTALPHPFPPAPSQSPLPAPAAQRNRSHVADNLHHESRSRSQTPSIETPSASIAPWAKEPAEASKGPSLREIQEAEAKTAAKLEAAAAEVRRAALEKELLAQAQTVAPAPGLPTSSNWANPAAASPTTPLSAAAVPAAWASKAAKTPTAAAVAKSMAQIQKEEEARKKRVIAAAATAQSAALGVVAAQSAGKRYADLASKMVAASSPGPPGVASAWTTVGASGKVKTPAPTPALAAARVPSLGAGAAAGVAAAGPASATAAKKAVAGRSVAGGLSLGGGSGAATVNAQDEFKKWAVNELRHDLNKGVPVEEFISNLLAFPSEVDIVTEAVHSVSNTIDSRHFAEEFLRRRKLADKGLFDASSVAKTAASPGGGVAGGERLASGGWSEVAKKSGPVKEKEDVASGSFKVVAAKKKGGKR